ncbi:hypothetical protein [Ferviditalea candida]|uniref:Uncharacterized protein n=1 Tax=Ferviditalea candida TaxID=3108399 RepID=A0ABU5ZL57_9BACL|nr:hypothetical protein [Paenibacillaceae bacterium T2]
MYLNGQVLTEDLHFWDHYEHRVPVQIYLEKQHNDIGFVEAITAYYIKINNVYYRREFFTFISRPGY